MMNDITSYITSLRCSCCDDVIVETEATTTYNDAVAATS